MTIAIIIMCIVLIWLIAATLHQAFDITDMQNEILILKQTLATQTVKVQP